MYEKQRNTALAAALRKSFRAKDQSGDARIEALLAELKRRAAAAGQDQAAEPQR